MHKSRRLRINDINPNLICVLCSGYLIDATTIIECLHSFCRSCIVKYLECNKYCPICDVQVHKTKPLLNIRSDQTLQDIVYKLVPGLFQNEMCKRRDFYALHPDQKPSSAEESGEVTQFSHIYTADESISLSLEYYNNNEASESDNNDNKVNPSRRYLRCPAAVSVQHLQKLIRAKYGLSNEHRVDILYLNDRLREDFTLMDIAYIYLWRRVSYTLSIPASTIVQNILQKVPLHLTYRIFEVSKKPKLDDSSIKTEHEANNKTWKEVQLQISENGIMSVTNIVEAKPEADVKTEVKEEAVEVKKENKEEKIEKQPEEVKIEEKIVQKEVVQVPEVKVCEKRKNDSICDDEPSAKLSKPSTSVPKAPPVQLKNVQQLSRNHPLKIHSQTIKINALKPITAPKTLPPLQKAPQCVTPLKTTQNSNKILNNNNSKIIVPATTIQSNVQATPKIETAKIEIPKEVTKSETSKIEAPLENKSSTTNSVQSIPKYTQASQSNDTTMTTNTKYAETSIQHPIQRIPTSTNSIMNSIPYSKVSIVPRKSPVKVGAPIGYKTLRDPPKTWNPQISRQNMVKSNTYCTTTASTSDSKADQKIPITKPAKFFKMRNNMPRYLGNPASGVKPMYQVREGDKSPPDIRKTLEVKKSDGESSTSYSKIQIDKIEVKKQGSIIKIDPKTLRPISDKMDSPSCSDVSEMKINQSTVPILNPLRTQKSQTSPKIDRRSPKTSYMDSPKSPLERNSPKMSVKNCQSSNKPLNSPTSKKDKLNLNFTPSNPFVPNLASPNLAPNQFLFPNYPSYDPRVMTSLPYHNLQLGLSMFYPPRLNYPGLSTQNLPLSPSLMSSLNLEVNKNLRVTKSFDITSLAQHSAMLEVKKHQTAKKLESPRENFNGDNTEKEQKNNNNKINVKKVEKIETPKTESKEVVKTTEVVNKSLDTEVKKTKKEEVKTETKEEKMEEKKITKVEMKNEETKKDDKQNVEKKEDVKEKSGNTA